MVDGEWLEWEHDGKENLLCCNVALIAVGVGPGQKRRKNAIKAKNGCPNRRTGVEMVKDDWVDECSGCPKKSRLAIWSDGPWR